MPVVSVSAWLSGGPRSPVSSVRTRSILTGRWRCSEVSLRDELERVRRQSQLTAANVVRAAEQDRAEYPHIYSRLEWDNDVAGPKYREVQAAELIRSVTVIRTIDSEPKEIRQYVSVAWEDG